MVRLMPDLPGCRFGPLRPYIVSIEQNVAIAATVRFHGSLEGFGLANEELGSRSLGRYRQTPPVCRDAVKDSSSRP